MAARSPPLPLKVLRLADRAAGLLAHGGTGLVQLALIFLGTHLAADHLDDLILAALEVGVDGLEHALAGPAMTIAAALELPPGRLMLWRGLPLGAAAAWTALVVELVVVWRLWSNLALVPFAATGTLEGWRKAQSVRAVVVPITLLGVLVAGAWSLAMATEDLLPASPVAGIAAALVGLAVFARHGMGALHRTIAGLDPNPPVRTGVLEALVLLPITCLVWTQCVPWWGLFELVGGLRQGGPVKGIAELLLSVAVLGAAWTRTPAGAMVRSVVAHAQDQPTEDILASFRAGLSEELDASLSRALVSVPTTVSADDAGLHTAIEASLGTEVSARIRDQVAAGKDAEAALEQHAVGTDARTRAIRRARSAGVTSPQRYAAHRRFLPDRLQRKADREVGDVLALATVLDMAWPVSVDARVTSPFGKRVHPVLGTHKMHDGVDIAVPTGTPVHATGAGKVRSAREAKVSGRYVVIDHGHGVSSNYCHADVLHVAKGDAVRAGQHILDSGNTGRSTGPHLHFGLRLHGRAIDPGRLRRPTSTSP